MIKFLDTPKKSIFEILTYVIFLVFFYRVALYSFDWIIAFKAALIDKADKIFWDFEVIYCAVKNLLLIQEPYKSIYTCSPSHKDFFYPYMPLTLQVFKPLLYLNFFNAKLLWGFLNILIFFYSFLCLKKILKSKYSLILYFLIIIFALDKTVIYSFISGNVSFILFSLFIIAYYHLLTNNRQLFFYFAVIFISLFNIYFLIYLFLPLFLKKKNSLFYISVSIFITLGIYYLDWIYEKDFFISYIKSFQTTLGGTAHGSSGIGFLNLFQKFSEYFSYNNFQTPIFLYLSFTTITLYIFFRIISKIDFNKEKTLFSALILLFLSILLPRLVVYEMILIVPLMLYLIENLEKFYTKKYTKVIFLVFFSFFLINGDSSLTFLLVILTFFITFLPAWRNW